MTDITDLIGPNPEPAPRPKFPTPWYSMGEGVYDDNGRFVAQVADAKTGEQIRLSDFIAQAVNEKIERDTQRATFEAMRERLDARLHEDAYGEDEDHIQERRVFEQAKIGDEDLHGVWPVRYRSDVAYWRDHEHLAFYRLQGQNAQDDGEGPVEAFYTLDKTQLVTTGIRENYIRENREPCSVLDVPEEFRL